MKHQFSPAQLRAAVARLTALMGLGSVLVGLAFASQLSAAPTGAVEIRSAATADAGYAADSQPMSVAVSHDFELRSGSARAAPAGPTQTAFGPLSRLNTAVLGVQGTARVEEFAANVEMMRTVRVSTQADYGIPGMTFNLTLWSIGQPQPAIQWHGNAFSWYTYAKDPGGGVAGADEEIGIRMEGAISGDMQSISVEYEFWEVDEPDRCHDRRKFAIRDLPIVLVDANEIRVRAEVPAGSPQRHSSGEARLDTRCMLTAPGFVRYGEQLLEYTENPMTWVSLYATGDRVPAPMTPLPSITPLPVGTPTPSPTPTPGPLKVTRSLPLKNAVNVDWELPAVEVEFDRRLDPQLVTDDSLKVFTRAPSGAPAAVTGQTSIAGDRTLRFVPSGPLLDGVRYTVEVPIDGVRATDGGRLADPWRGGFSTVPNIAENVEIVVVQVVEGAQLITDKPTLVRVFARWDARIAVHPSARVPDVEADVRLLWRGATSGSAEQRGVRIRREYRTTTNLNESYSRGEKVRADDSINFTAFTPTSPGAVDLMAEIIPVRQLKDRVRKFSPKDWHRVGTVASPSMNVHLDALAVGAWSATPAPGGTVSLAGAFDKQLQFLEDVYPVAPAKLRIHSTSPLTAMRLSLPPPSSPLIESSTLLRVAWYTNWLQNQCAALGSGTNMCVALVPEPWAGAPGQTFGSNRNAALLEADRRAARYEPALAHELGHNLAWPGRPRPGYDPHHEVEADDGFRVGYLARRTGDRRNSVRKLPGPTSLNLFKALMWPRTEVQNPLWITRDEYATLHTALSSGGPLPFSASPAPAGRGEGPAGSRAGPDGAFATTRTERVPDQALGSVLLAAGLYAPSSGEHVMQSWWRLPGVEDTPGSPSPMALVFYAAGGTELGRAAVFAETSDETWVAWRSASAVPAGTARIDLVYEGEVIHTRTASPAPPSVSIVALAGGTLSGTQPIRWDANDPDGDQLSFAVQISEDAGATWMPVAFDISGSERSLDTRAYPNGNDYRLRVMSTDGFHTTMAESSAFGIRNAPFVETFDPSDGETDVPTEARVAITFSSPVQPSTVNAGTIRVTDGAGRPVAGSVAYDPLSSTAAFEPRHPWSHGTTFTVQVEAAVRGTDGAPLAASAQATFSVSADSSPPRVASVWPPDGVTDASPGSAVRVTFDEPVARTGVANALHVFDVSGVTVSGQVTIGPAGDTVVFRPAESFKLETTYTATVSEDLSDASGNLLEAPYSWSFATGRTWPIALPITARRSAMSGPVPPTVLPSPSPTWPAPPTHVTPQPTADSTATPGGGSPTLTPASVTPVRTPTPQVPTATPASPTVVTPTPISETPTPPTPTMVTPTPMSATPTSISAPSPTPGTDFVDDFCDSTSGWPSGFNDAVAYGYRNRLVGCEYYMHFQVADRAWWATPNLTAATFRIEASTSFVGSGGAGLLFGLTPTSDRYFMYMIDELGRYGLWRHDSGGWTALIPQTPSQLIDPAFGNRIALEAAAGSVQLFVDGTEVDRFDGLDHTGRVGLYAESWDSGFEATYDDFALYMR